VETEYKSWAEAAQASKVYPSTIAEGIELADRIFNDHQTRVNYSSINEMAFNLGEALGTLNEQKSDASDAVGFILNALYNLNDLANQLHNEE